MRLISSSRSASPGAPRTRGLLPAPAPLAAAATLLLGACSFTPSHVEGADIDDALIQGRIETVCVGLKMKDDDVRRYAAERLQTVSDPLAAECVCAALPHETLGWDSAVANGLRTTNRDDLAGCFADLVVKPDLPKRLEAVVILGTMSADRARAAMRTIGADASSSAEIRVKAIESLAANPASIDMLIKVLETDTEASVRAAAAGSIALKGNAPAKAALRKAAASDAEGAVRAKALLGLKQVGASDADDLLCEAMLNDSSAEVRTMAVGAYRGTRRTSAVKCLRTRAFKLEEDAGVRTKILEVLKSSPSKDATAVLCDAIPFWTRSYLKQGMPDKVPGTDIITAQNDRDFENSYACVEKAVRAGGYSCFGQAYTAFWFRTLGGTAHVPRCPGYE